jgi:hypothetical protein
MFDDDDDDDYYYYYYCYVDFISPLVGSQRQADAIYFDLSNAFELVPHSLLLRKLSAFGLSSGCVSWFRSYLSNRNSQVRVSGVLQGCT